MSEVWQCAAGAYREIRSEGWAAVLGLFGLSEVPNDAKFMSGVAREKGKASPGPCDLSEMSWSGKFLGAADSGKSFTFVLI